MTPHSRKPQRPEPHDVGTLWTLRREEYTARCSLLSWSSEWELRVVIEKDVLHSRRCSSTADAFELAEHWQRGLVGHGWQQIIPMSAAAGAFHDTEVSEVPDFKNGATKPTEKSENTNWI